jgi:hypothetical protein
MLSKKNKNKRKSIHFLKSLNQFQNCHDCNFLPDRRYNCDKLYINFLDKNRISVTNNIITRKSVGDSYDDKRNIKCGFDNYFTNWCFFSRSVESAKQILVQRPFRPPIQKFPWQTSDHFLASLDFHQKEPLFFKKCAKI